MKKPQPTTPAPQASRTWERLEEFVREHVQRFIQALLTNGLVSVDPRNDTSILQTKFSDREGHGSCTSSLRVIPPTVQTR
jgi:hypothetical protein